MLPKEGWKPSVLTVAPEWQYLPTNTDETPGADVKVIRTRHWKVLNAIERAGETGKLTKQDDSQKESRKNGLASTDPEQHSTDMLSHRRLGMSLRGTVRSLYHGVRPTDADFLFPFFAVPKGYFASRNSRHTAIYSIGKPFSSIVAGQVLASLLRLPHVIEFHDPWTLSPSYGGKGLIAWLEKRLERWLVANADAVIAKTDAELRLLRDAHPGSAARFFTVPCGFDETRLPDPVTVSPPRSSSDGVIRIVHGGALSERRSPVNFLLAVKKLLEDTPSLRDKLMVTFAGRFGLFEGYSLPEWCVRLGLSKTVDVKGWLRRKDLYDLMADADIFVVFPDNWHQIPAKIYEYLWFGRAILVVCEEGSESAGLVRKHERGTLALRNDPDSIAKALYSLVEQCQTGPPRSAGDEALFPYSARGRAKAVAEILNSITKRVCREASGEGSSKDPSHP